MGILLVILFLSRKKFHTEQVFVLSSSNEIWHRCFNTGFFTARYNDLKVSNLRVWLCFLQDIPCSGSDTMILVYPVHPKLNEHCWKKSIEIQTHSSGMPCAERTSLMQQNFFFLLIAHLQFKIYWIKAFRCPKDDPLVKHCCKLGPDIRNSAHEQRLYRRTAGSSKFRDFQPFQYFLHGHRRY